MKQSLILIKHLFIIGLTACYSMVKASTSNFSWKKEVADSDSDISETVSRPGESGVLEIGLKEPNILNIPAPRRGPDPRSIILNKVRGRRVRDLMLNVEVIRDSGNSSSRSCECLPSSQPHLHPEGQRLWKVRPWHAWQYVWLGRKSQRRWYFSVADFLRDMHTRMR